MKSCGCLPLVAGVALLCLHPLSQVFGSSPAATATTLAVGVETITKGKPLELTARVISATGVPTGSVSFYDGTKMVGTAKLNELEIAEFFIATLEAGSHSISAQFAGGSVYARSTSAPITVTVTPSPSGTTTLNVPAQYKTIQAAINAAKVGDTVVVARGTYTENIDFEGKAIVVTSQSGPETTIIDGGGTDPVVLFKNGETRESVLNGFTIRNGADISFDSPAAIYIDYASSPSITSNIFTENAGCGIWMAGSPYIAGNTIEHTLQPKGYCTPIEAAIYLSSSGSGLLPEIVRNTIGDTAAAGIPGIASFGTDTTLIEENIIRNNTGGGIVAVNDSPLLIVGNLITGNTGAPILGNVSSGIDISVPFGSTGPTIVNNTILGNHSASAGSSLSGPQVDIGGYYNNSSFWNNIVIGVDSGPPIYCDPSYLPDGPPPAFQNNDAYSPEGTGFGGGCEDETGKNGNISADPMFVNAGGPDFSLLRSSPVIDAGTNAAPYLPVFDLSGQPRIQPGPGGKLIVDMGALEYTSQTEATLSTTSLTFGTLTIYATSAAKTVTLTDTGVEPLHIQQIAATGDFSETNSCETAFGIPAGSNCTIKVAFSPTARGTRSGALTIRSNAAAGPLTVNLKGTATGAIASLLPDSITFAEQQLFSASAAKQITLSNSGDDVLTISSVSASGDFAAQAACRTVDPGKSCAVNVVFKPTARGQRTGTLTIQDNATARTQTAKLAGIGIGADISFSASQFVFTGVPLNVISEPQMLTVSNHGESTLDSKFQVAGPFAANGNCGSTLAAGKSCALHVMFAPIVEGPSYGSIAFFDNAAASPQTVSLFGTAGVPAASILPDPLTFPTVIVDTKGTAYVGLYNSGTAYLTVSAVSISGPFKQTNNCIGTIEVYASCLVAITYAPSSVAPVSGSLTFTDGAPGGPQKVPITASGATTHTVPAIASLYPGAIQAGGPDSYVSIIGPNFFADSVIEWNGIVLKTSPYSPTGISAIVPSKLIATPGQATVTVFNPAPGGGTSNAMTVNIYSRVMVSARDMVWDSSRKLIYLSTDTKSSTHPNQVLSLDPTTGEFGSTLLSGNEPGKLAITPDGEYLYAETDKNNSVTRIELATGKPDLTFALGNDYWGPYIALDMVPVPGDDSSVAIALGGPTSDQSSMGVQIFTNGEGQPSQVLGMDSNADHLLYIDSANTLYASDTEDTGMTLSVFTINSAGLSVENTYRGLGGGQLATDGKNIFVGDGQVISPVTFTSVATLPFYAPYFPIVNSVTVDTEVGMAYFGSSSSYGGLPAIEFVSTSTFKVLGEINLEDYYPASGADHIIRFGTNGIVFRASGPSLSQPGTGSAQDSIILLQTDLVNAK